MKTLLTNFKNVQGLDSGPLCRHIQPYISHVHEQGYTLKTIRYHLRLMANFNRWLVRTGRGLRDLNETTIEAFLPRLFGQRTWRAGERPALLRMLCILRETRAIPPAKMVQLTPAQAVAAQYRQYLTDERGCSDCTVENYSRHIDRFLAHRFVAGPVNLHLGIEPDFHPAKRAHPALVVDDLDDIVAACERAALATKPDTSFNHFRRVHVFDPFGNRLELLESRTL